MTEKEIVQALRCVGKPKPFTSKNCKVCPYWAKETLVEWQQKAGWAACKVYDIPPDAADIIERLTAENADLRKEIKSAFTPDASIKLAAQALGTTPERLRELAAADKEGRVVVLPCKVYETDGVRVYEHAVRGIIYRTAGGPDFDESTIGKSIFLTREEAERAMEGNG